MLNITSTLQGLTSGYTVFERNQVLTEAQLNGLAEYLNEQGRLTRVGLAGVGIACGLKISIVNKGTIRVTRGTAVTTDGDLVLLGADQDFDGYKPYDESAPVYAPLLVDGAMVPTFELVAAGVADERAIALASFEDDGQRVLADMVGVILMESFVKDEDLCKGTDCDNLGGGYVNTVKLLLVDRQSAKRLKESFPTLDSASRRLAVITAARAIVTPANATPSALAKAYRTACNSIHADLVRVLPKLYPAGSWFLSDIFDSDPSGAWRARLDAEKARYAGTDVGIQYYYSHLKHLVETWNLIGEVLFGERAVCSPPVEEFPKHLLLGPLVAPNQNTSLRTGFYPSPVIREHTDRWGQARSLIWRLHTMVNTFKVPAVAADVRITPSHFEDRPLHDRAIPYFYEVTKELPIHRAWNFHLDRRGMETYNYSYNADRYGGEGGARNPLATQIGPFPFFRIEGHLGLPVSQAVDLIRDQIAKSNLPFTVDSAMLGADKGKLVKPRPHYTDLHRLHYLIRQDIAYQLDDAAKFSGDFKGKVDTAVASKAVTNAASVTDDVTLQSIASAKHSAVTTSASAAITKLSKPYATFVTDQSWTTDVNGTIAAAADFKSDLGKVVKTEFTTPFDGLIASPHLNWIDWLGIIIKDKDDKVDARKLFSTFAAQHTGGEHFGGVLRGGTFVLIYDEAQKVVGDLGLPYQVEQEVEEQPAEPALPRPGVTVPWTKGIKILPSVGEQLGTFQAKIEPLWKKDILTQREYFDVFKESVTLVAGVTGPKGPGFGLNVDNSLLGRQLEATNALSYLIDGYREEMLKPSLDEPMRVVLKTRLKQAEGDLATQAAATGTLVSSLNLDLSPGSDGVHALATISHAVGKLHDRDAVRLAAGGLGAAATDAHSDVQIALHNVVQHLET